MKTETKFKDRLVCPICGNHENLWELLYQNAEIGTWLCMNTNEEHPDKDYCESCEKSFEYLMTEAEWNDLDYKEYCAICEENYREPLTEKDWNNNHTTNINAKY